jgi:hypothetical protein
MKVLSYIILVVLVLECSAQKEDTTGHKFLYENEILFRDTVYLDTLIIDNEAKLFTSKKWIAKSSINEIYFIQTIYNKTKNTLELSATGNFVPAYDREVKPSSCAKISYHLYLKGKKGPLSKEGTITYRPKHLGTSQHIIVVLTGLKEYEQTEVLDTIFIADTTNVSYSSNLEFKKTEDVMLKLVLKNLTGDTINIDATSGNKDGLVIYDYTKQTFAPSESDYFFFRVPSWRLNGKFSEVLNITYSLTSARDSTKKITKRLIEGQVND